MMRTLFLSAVLGVGSLALLTGLTPSQARADPYRSYYSGSYDCTRAFLPHRGYHDGYGLGYSGHRGFYGGYDRDRLYAPHYYGTYDRGYSQGYYGGPYRGHDRGHCGPYIYYGRYR
jgi:hypothetical protein